MSSKIQRSALTTELLTTLSATGKPVGDGVAPRGPTGWQGQPNAEGTNYLPYAVLTSLATAMGTGTLSDPNEDLWFNYGLVSYGASRPQCEDLADMLRFAAQSLNKVTVTMWQGTAAEYGRRIQSVVVTSYGAVQPVGDTDPRIFGVADSLSLWTTG